MLDTLVISFVEIIDLVTILIIFYSFLVAVCSFVAHHTHKAFNWPKHSKKLSTIRVKLGEYLLLALEIFICADIILSVKDPSVEHLMQLGVIVLIRILIAYFLQKEIFEIEEHKLQKKD